MGRSGVATTWRPFLLQKSEPPDALCAWWLSDLRFRCHHGRDCRNSYAPIFGL